MASDTRKYRVLVEAKDAAQINAAFSNGLKVWVEGSIVSAVRKEDAEAAFVTDLGLTEARIVAVSDSAWDPVEIALEPQDPKMTTKREKGPRTRTTKREPVAAGATPGGSAAAAS